MRKRIEEFDDYIAATLDAVKEMLVICTDERIERERLVRALNQASIARERGELDEADPAGYTEHHHGQP
jgi:hypothetical protein